MRNNPKNSLSVKVKTNFRTAITIPEKSWSRFRDIFADYVEKMKEQSDKQSQEGGKWNTPRERGLFLFCKEILLAQKKRDNCFFLEERRYER